MINSIDIIPEYQDVLDNIYNEWIEPILSNKQELVCSWDASSMYRIHYNVKPIFDINNTNTLDRCSYDTYKEIYNKYGLKFKALNDSCMFLFGMPLPSNKELGMRVLRMVSEFANKFQNEHNTGPLKTSSSYHVYRQYKDLNGFMGWHTNINRPGDRWYLVYNTDDKSSFTRCIDNKTGEVITHWEPKGWSINHFVLGNKDNPLWHCVYSKTNRFSFGIMNK